MRKKLISKTYLKDVTEYNLSLYLDNNDYYLSVKNILNINKPFITESNLCLINNNYYIVEVIPKNKNYCMRLFFNDKKERLLYYFDITLENGLDEDIGIPYYYDLYLDVVLKDNKISILDEDELLDALHSNKISLNEYNLAVKQKDLLISSINDNNNKYINLDFSKYLN